MNPRRYLIAVAMVAAVLVGCGKPKSESATVQLERSFEKTDESTRQEVARAGTALQAKEYTRAIVIMDRVVQAHPPDLAQKQAVDAVIIQTRRAVEQNPKLASPELYKAMSDLVFRVHGEP